MKLVNFAIMPNPGNYKLSELTKEEFTKIIKKNDIESFVAFKITASIIEELTGKKIEVNKKRCYFDKAEKYLIVILKEKEKFKKRLTADDFIYYQCEYIP